MSIYGAPMDADTLKHLRDLGVGRMIFALPSAEADTLLSLLDRGMRVVRTLG